MLKDLGFLLFVASSVSLSCAYSQPSKGLTAEVRQPSVSEKYPKIESSTSQQQPQAKAPANRQQSASSSQKQQAKQQQPEEIQQMLQKSADAASAWLKLVDQDKYGESWSSASEIFRVTIPKGDWIKLLERIRKPYGRAISREVIDQRIAIDPKGLPPGDYMVLIYNTTFANKPSGVELVTLRKEKDGWKVLTYQVK